MIYFDVAHMAVFHPGVPPLYRGTRLKLKSPLVPEKFKFSFLYTHVKLPRILSPNGDGRRKTKEMGEKDPEDIIWNSA